jgi:hypothetical protein
MPSRDLVGLRIHNAENLQDKVGGISLGLQEQHKPDVVWCVLVKVIQSNARIVLNDRLKVHLEHVRMPNGNGGVKTKGLSLYLMSAIKKNIVRLKMVVNCFAYGLIIAMVKLMYN